MSDPKTFATRDVITASTGFLYTDIQNVYDILGWLLYAPGIMTHEIPEGIHAAQPVLEAQFPWLADLDLQAVTGAAREARVNAAIQAHGKTLEVFRPEMRGQF